MLFCSMSRNAPAQASCCCAAQSRRGAGRLRKADWTTCAASSGGCGTRTRAGMRPRTRCLAAEASTRKCWRRAMASMGTGQRRLLVCRCLHPDSDPNANPSLSQNPNPFANGNPSFCQIVCNLAGAVVHSHAQQACAASCACARRGRAWLGTPCKHGQCVAHERDVPALELHSAAALGSTAHASRAFDHVDAQ